MSYGGITVHSDQAAGRVRQRTFGACGVVDMAGRIAYGEGLRSKPTSKNASDT